MNKLAELLKKLLDFTGTEPWQSELAALFDQHLAGTCAEWEIAGRDELVEIIGQDQFMMIWAFIYDDFLTSQSPQGNAIDAFLAENTGLSNDDRRYLAALRDAPLSLLQIVEVKPGKSFLARDKLNNDRPVTILEQAASEQLSKGLVIATRVLDIAGETQLSGALLPFYGDQQFDLFFAADGTETRPASAASVTAAWLDGVLADTLPDDDAFDAFELSFGFKKGVTGRKVRDALDRIDALETQSPTEWQWHADDETVLDLTIEGRTLLVTTFSEEQTMELIGILEPALGRLLDSPTITAIDDDDDDDGLDFLPEHDDDMIRLAEIMNDIKERPDLAKTDPNADEARFHEMMTLVYKKQLLMPVPELDNEVPKDLAKSAEGRDRLAQWLTSIEAEAMQGEPAAQSYDYRWLWTELGVTRPSS